MRRYFPLIDAVRFLAALGVGLHHLGFTAWRADSTFPALIVAPPAGSKPVIEFGWALWVGVEVFFVISGAVIAASALDSSPVRFLRGRFLRLYPAVWICSAVIAVITVGLGVVYGNLPVRIVSSALINPLGPWLDPVFWTLAVELCFYALVWLSLTQAIPIERVACGLVVWSAAYLVLSYFDLGLSPAIERPLLLRHGVFFALGILLWSWGARRLTPAHIPFLVLSILGAFYEVAVKAEEAAISFFGSAADHSAGWPVAIFAAATAVIALSLRWLSTPRPLTTLRTLGLITYPLYLVHTAVGGLVMHELLVAGVDPTAALCAGLIGAVLAGWVISAFAEPALRAAVANQIDTLFFRRSREV
ncbi:MAG: acyltransferase [Bosea sp.]|nr:acyltransferase [Bosea sp. (in: a-proteobacteria)]